MILLSDTKKYTKAFPCDLNENDNVLLKMSRWDKTRSEILCGSIRVLANSLRGFSGTTLEHMCVFLCVHRKDSPIFVLTNISNINGLL